MDNRNPTSLYLLEQPGGPGFGTDGQHYSLGKKLCSRWGLHQIASGGLSPSKAAC